MDPQHGETHGRSPVADRVRPDLVPRATAVRGLPAVALLPLLDDHRLRPRRVVGHCHHRMVGPVVARSDGVRRYRRPVGRPPPHWLLDGRRVRLDPAAEIRTGRRHPGLGDHRRRLCHRRHRRAHRPHRASGSGSDAGRRHVRVRKCRPRLPLQPSVLQRRPAHAVGRTRHLLRGRHVRPAQLLLLHGRQCAHRPADPQPSTRLGDRPSDLRRSRQPRHRRRLHGQPHPYKAAGVRSRRMGCRPRRWPLRQPAARRPLRRRPFPDRRIARGRRHRRDRRTRLDHRRHPRCAMGDRSTGLLPQQRTRPAVHLVGRPAHHVDVLPGRVHPDRQQRSQRHRVVRRTPHGPRGGPGIEHGRTGVDQPPPQ